ncbi:MAG: 2-C-methyl-D-erythritol 2,4-cyclodiphosphate synthase [Clostridia bacterium]|nr:2-C-methyl-D-erythritol 2,4-cyclodiphosphate synthase [Clostridia bacterium]
MIRIGYGYDVHRYAEGRRLVLGGVTVPFEKGLLGHSDADVLIHAVIDALLGAAAAGDIGALFPDTSDEYKDADSRVLLRKTLEVIKAKGYRVSNVDATVICQRPKLAPHILKMRENIAADLGVDAEAVSVKATTEEKLGFTGREEGVAAAAVALIEK